MPSEQIQWFPGHMAKTRRLITENLKDVDLVMELLDARIPKSSENPEIARLVAGKPRLTLLSKTSLADPEATKRWQETFRTEGRECIFYDCKTGEGLSKIPEAARRLCADKLSRYQEKGMDGRRLRAMIVGIPNVGKSSLINRLAQNNKAKVENRPGVTLTKQWISTGLGVDLLDMPGILWPKFEDQTVGQNLALTGAIRDEIMDIETLACVLCNRLRILYPTLLMTRYKIREGEMDDLRDYEVAELIGRRRGFLISGGEVDFLRTSNMLLDEFRGGKLGRITIEHPEVREAHHAEL